VHALEYADAGRDAHDLHTAAFLDTRRRNWLQAPQVRVLDCLACVRSAAGYRRGLRDSAQVRVSDGDMGTNKTFFVRAANSPLSASLWLFLTLPSVQQLTALRSAAPRSKAPLPWEPCLVLRFLGLRWAWRASALLARLCGALSYAVGLAPFLATLWAPASKG
jgi:hypothetical protein